MFKDEIAHKGDYVRDVTIETDVEMLIPDEYVSNTQERLNLYTELDSLKTEEDIEAYSERLTDRFGPLPKQVFALFEALRLQWICKKLGFERLILKRTNSVAISSATHSLPSSRPSTSINWSSSLALKAG